MNTICVEQLIFGYENGHRLLATSLETDLIQQKEVEILSDASGSGRFVDYISCFPLVEDGYYAFAKTWYADEMERPGCVWTHMLLIRFEDLDYMSGRIDIESLFQRPNREAESRERYQKTLMVSENTDRNLLYSDYVIYTLFYSEKKALIEDSRLEEYEKDLLSILPKLHSKILMNLSVCTCSFRNRYIFNDVFSYQITNVGNAKKLSWDIEDSMIYRSKNSIEEYPLWVKYINRMLASNRQQEIYNFCKKYNCYEREFIKDFSKLLYTVKEFKESYDLLKFIELTTKLEQGEKIKNRTLELLFVESDEEMLQCFDKTSIMDQLIFEMQNMKGFFTKNKLKKSSIEKNAKKLYLEKDKEKIRTAFNKYIHNELNECGNAIVVKMIELLKPSDLNVLFNMELKICIVLISSDSRFLLCDDIWKQRKNYQLQVLSCVKCSQIVQVNKVLMCILDNTKENISNEIYEIFGDRYLGFLFEYCKEGRMKYPYQAAIWGHHLALEREKCIRFLPKINDGDLLVEIMKNINSYDITESEEIDKWINAINNNLNYILKRYKYESALFLLPLVLKKRSVSDTMLDLVYNEIYQKLEKSEMDYQDWKKMDAILPSVDVQQSWDKCLRLRLAFNK